MKSCRRSSSIIGVVSACRSGRLGVCQTGKGASQQGLAGGGRSGQLMISRQPAQNIVNSQAYVVWRTHSDQDITGPAESGRARPAAGSAETPDSKRAP